ncbi:MAG: PIN domain-containing protein [Kiritimatiellae bacterium]|nr:PIN domain-containing protein [Kiritimatiellia bacterium]
MDRLFFDTNVLLDMLEQRAPWFPDSTACIACVRREQTKGAITALSLSDIAYIQKSAPPLTLTDTFKRLREFLDIAPLTANTVDEALMQELPDIEDGFQLASALAWGATHLLTRNLKDFPAIPSLIIQHPADYLRSRNATPPSH